MELIERSLAVGLVLGVLDGLWLAVISRKWTEQQLGQLMRKPLSWPPALAFYVMYSVALAFFAVGPAMSDPMPALGLGAFLGLVAYGTYELTNLSVVKGWPPAFAAVDIVWGMFVSAVSAAGAVVILNLI